MDRSTDVAALGRDPDAFEAFYREHLPWVRRFVARRVDDPHTAADLTADIFLAVIDGAAGYRATSGTPAAWLAGVARHVVADHFRRRVRDARATARLSGRALLDELSFELIADRIDGERMSREIYRSLSGLPDSQRAVVELVAVDGLSLAAAAQVLGISAGNARVRYHRARSRLQHVLPSPFEVTARPSMLRPTTFPTSIRSRPRCSPSSAARSPTRPPSREPVVGVAARSWPRRVSRPPP